MWPRGHGRKVHPDGHKCQWIVAGRGSLRGLFRGLFLAAELPPLAALLRPLGLALLGTLAEFLALLVGLLALELGGALGLVGILRGLLRLLLGLLRFLLGLFGFLGRLFLGLLLFLRDRRCRFTLLRTLLAFLARRLGRETEGENDEGDDCQGE